MGTRCGTPHGLLLSLSLAGAVIVASQHLRLQRPASVPVVPWPGPSRGTCPARAIGVPVGLLPRAVVRGRRLRGPRPRLRFQVRRRPPPDRRPDRVRRRRPPTAARSTVTRAARRLLRRSAACPSVFLLTGVLGFLIGFGVFVLRAEDRQGPPLLLAVPGLLLGRDDQRRVVRRPRAPGAAHPRRPLLLRLYA
ncbi:MAG: hypothetical protein MZU84_09245 [Sphingobacterium sp.]|nr:hypothetical protein [Sphingobacterium sp.]